MFDILKHAHSGWRWIVLLLLIYAISNAFTKWKNGSTFEPSDRKVNLFTTTAVHIQLLLGLALYFMSVKVQFNAETMKDGVLRFFTVEHALLMLIAVILVTIGNAVSKKAVADALKFKRTFVYFLIALILILVAIPWPFQKYGAGWF